MSRRYTRMRGRGSSAVIAVAIVVALAGTARAQSPVCSNVTLGGAWGYTETGSVIAPSPTGGTVTVTAAAVGRYVFTRTGTFEGDQHSSANGAVGQDQKLGIYTINPDCTGTLTLTVFRSGVSQRLSVWAFVIVDVEGRPEMQAIMTSMTMPNGVALAPIMTMIARPVDSRFPTR